MLHILYGPDTFSLQEALTHLRASLADDMLATNTTYLEGPQTTPEEVLNAASAIPFLGEHRLVIVHGLLRRFQPPAGSRGRAAPPPELGVWQRLVDAIEGLPESTVLVLTDEELSRGSSLLKALAPAAQVQEFRRLGIKALPAWINRRAREKGLALSPQAIGLLVSSVGDNLWAQDQELEKLAIYASGRAIGEEEVRALVAAAREFTVYSLVDAAVEGKEGTALRLLRQRLAAGEESGRLLTALARQYRLVLLAKEMQQAGASPQQIGQELGIGWPFLLRKVLEQAARYSPAGLKAAYRRLLEADLTIKRGQQSEDLALELLLADLTRQR